MEEIWKDIIGYEGLYQASNIGRVRSVPISGDGIGKGKGRKGGVIASTSRNGYLSAELSKDGKARPVLIHRLVWEAFNGPIPEGMQVNHINEDKTDNRIGNLNLMTPKENTHWGTGIERGAAKRRKRIVQLLPNGEEFACWFSIRYAADSLKISEHHISACCNGHRKIAGGFSWKFAN